MSLHELYHVPYVNNFFNIFHSLLDIAQLFAWFFGIVVGGMLIGRGVYFLVNRMLRLCRFDRLVGRLELDSVFSPSRAVARFCYFGTVILFFLVALQPVTTVSMNDRISQLYFMASDALVLSGIIFLGVFLAHYGGGFLRYMFSLTGFNGGEAVYVVFVSIIMIGVLEEAFTFVFELSRIPSTVLFFMLLVGIPPGIAFRGRIYSHMTGDKK